MITITDGKFSVERFADSPRRAHCFFEWIYFANVASTLDDRSVYLSRKALGEELARLEDVADRRATRSSCPCPTRARPPPTQWPIAGRARVEGLIRNRYSGRTFIEGAGNRRRKPPPNTRRSAKCCEGKRVLLVEDSIVRSTTMHVLLIRKIRAVGRAKEIHVRVACPPIIAPCFYGIDMSTISRAVRPAVSQRRPPAGRDVRRDGPRTRGRFAPLPARRVDRPSGRPAGRRTLPGLHHGRVSDAARPEALSNRTRPTPSARAVDVERQPVGTYVRNEASANVTCGCSAMSRPSQLPIQPALPKVQFPFGEAFWVWCRVAV